MRHPLFAALVAATVAMPSVAATPAPDKALVAAVADPGRSEANRARDRFRHPVETLTFFGVTPRDTLVEIQPGGGWYAEILAPMLATGGRYIAAVPAGRYRDGWDKRAAADPKRYGKAQAVVWDAKSPIAPDGTADRVVTFRNVHNFIMSGVAEDAFKTFYKALKPGGTLGVVEHRLPEGKDSALEQSSGYVKRSTVVRLAEQAGFRLAGESEVNANPKDTHDHPKGVWTLPPSLQLGDTDRAKYQAIGESDRMTLKFVKPAA